jgi:beta-glucosidase
MSESEPAAQGATSMNEEKRIRSRIAQLIMARWDASASPDAQDRQIREALDLGIGKFILFGGALPETPERIRQLRASSPTEILIASDIEDGVGAQIRGATRFPPALAVGKAGDPRLAAEMGRLLAREARAAGIDLAFAPVLDVYNNPENPIIATRAYGETTEAVCRAASAFLQGCLEEGLLTCGKHFPGHGDTSVDSHSELPSIPHPLERLRRVELPPFRTAISEGVDTLMTAHIRYPQLDDRYPATLSRRLIRGLLRDELGFDRAVFTDALTMSAITKHFDMKETPLLALEAGCDILLIPPDPRGTIEAVARAVQSGRIPEDRIEASLKRLSRLKPAAKYAGPLPDPEGGAVALAIARKSLKRLRDPRRLLPLSPNRPIHLFVLDDDHPIPPCDALEEALRSHLPIVSSTRIGPGDHHQIPSPSDPTGTAVIAVFSRIRMNKDRAGLSKPLADVLSQITQRFAGKSVALLFGPPVLERLLPQDAAVICAFGQTPESQRAAGEFIRIPASTNGS